MKKFFILFAAAMFSAAAFAQFANNGGSRGSNSASEKFWSSEKPEKTITTGVHVGLNVANMQEDYPARLILGSDNDIPVFDPSAGFNIGYDVLYSFNKNLGLKTGIELTKKGTKYKQSYVDKDGRWLETREETVKGTAFYFEIPVTVRYQINFTDEFNVFADQGFYFAFGAFGKSKAEYSYLEEYDGRVEDRDSGSEKFNTFGKNKFTDEDIKDGWKSVTEYDKALKRFDFGTRSGIGVSYKQYNFSFNYSIGMMNILPEKIKVTESYTEENYSEKDSDVISFKDCSLKNRSWSINIGITF